MIPTKRKCINKISVTISKHQVTPIPNTFLAKLETPGLEKAEKEIRYWDIINIRELEI